MLQWYIYALIDPRDQAVRYVGFTSTTIANRLKNHIKDATFKVNGAYRYEYHRCRWIRSLLALNLQPQAVQLEMGQGPSWAEAECRWIKHFRDAGASLRNHTDGGDGCPGLTRDPAYLEKARQRMLGNTLWVLSIPRTKEVNTGKKHTLETKAKMSAAHKGQVRTLEHRKNNRIKKAAKLTDQDIRDIRRLKGGSETQQQVADRYGVSRSAVSRIHRGLLGKLVED